MRASKSITTALVAGGAFALGRVAGRRALRRMASKRRNVIARHLRETQRALSKRLAPPGRRDPRRRKARLRPVVVSSDSEPRGLARSVASAYRVIERALWAEEPDASSVRLRAREGVPRLRTLLEGGNDGYAADGRRRP
jgi:hypothetical protein